MAYTTIKKSTDYFNTKLYTGTGATRSITGVGFQPDWVWIKARNYNDNHRIVDAVRGVTKDIYSDLNLAEGTNTNGLTAFGSDGFTLGSDGGYNGNTDSYASWNWLANNTSGSSNTDGSITSTVSANTTSGFSIVKWTGSGATATIGHGLGSVPKMIIVKNTNASENWIVYHSTLGSSKHLKLNLSDAEATTGGTWNHTNPTANVFTVHTNTNVNANGNSMIAYCFTDVTGYSKFGSYVGNSNTDGTFVYTGFKPAFVMIKNTTNGNNWFILDNKRTLFNLADDSLFPNSNSAEMTTQPTNYGLDILSNGMKMRTSGDHLVNNNNASGNTYIYMAFAEEPLVGDNPATAR